MSSFRLDLSASGTAFPPPEAEPPQAGNGLDLRMGSSAEGAQVPPVAAAPQRQLPIRAGGLRLSMSGSGVQLPVTGLQPQLPPLIPSLSPQSHSLSSSHVAPARNTFPLSLPSPVAESKDWRRRGQKGLTFGFQDSQSGVTSLGETPASAYSTQPQSMTGQQQQQQQQLPQRVLPSRPAVAAGTSSSSSSSFSVMSDAARRSEQEEARRTSQRAIGFTGDSFQGTVVDLTQTSSTDQWQDHPGNPLKRSWTSSGPPNSLQALNVGGMETKRQMTSSFPNQGVQRISGVYTNTAPDYNQILYQDLQHSTSTKGLAELDAPDTLTIPLRSYQKQALAWMVGREGGRTDDGEDHARADSSNTAGKKGKMFTGSTEEFITHHSAERQAIRPYAVGGILADEMGMGKTIEILSLILTEREPKRARGGAADRKRVPKGTLIVCPLSLMQQWVNEIHKNTKKNTLRTYIYHGANRIRRVGFLREHDVVVTTYATLSSDNADYEKKVARESSDGSKRKKETSVPALMENVWFRVVLDEAHNIKERGTKSAKAATALQTERRWAVTGTPIQNKLDDLFSLAIFLHVELNQKPLDYKQWQRMFAKPVRSLDAKGNQRLHALLELLLLRRTKAQRLPSGLPIVSLPPKTITIRTLEFSLPEHDVYESLWLGAKTQFSELVAAGTVLQNYAHILELLLRLRQCCDHPFLVTKVKSMERDAPRTPRTPQTPEKNASQLAANAVRKLRDFVSYIISQTTRTDNADDGDIDNASFAIQSDEQRRATRAFLTDEVQQNTGCFFGDVECESCVQLLEDSCIVTFCGHVFCQACWKDIIVIPSETTDAMDDVATVEAPDKIRDVVPCLVCQNQLSVKESICVVDELSRSSATRGASIDVEELSSLPSQASASAGSQDLSTPVSRQTRQDKMALARDIRLHFRSSTKVDALLYDLTALERSRPGAKSIIFSQWTSMLDLVSVALSRHDIGFTRLDGTMPQQVRESNIMAFRNKRKTRVFLVSMKAGGVGLNLTAAERVFLLDPWWNPAAEDQAIDRVHRLGQLRPVGVIRYVIKDTVEEKLLSMQENKRKMAHGALSGQTAALRQMRIEELQALFREGH